MNELKIILDAPKSIANVCCRAINVDLKHMKMKRCKVALNYEKNLLELVIKSSDLSAMRAAMNTYLRWIMMCFNLIDVNN